MLAIQEKNGEVWGALGHCYLVTLCKRCTVHLSKPCSFCRNQDDLKLWYGLGILYDRYGSLGHTEEAFGRVLKMDRDFDKANKNFIWGQIRNV
ncbi:hypothetical protein C8J56DRAFT_164629 [Mycena floridula]|nr:hypothetical protein C8J56DRAFT_164629 [Mycena floridula]